MWTNYETYWTAPQTRAKNERRMQKSTVLPLRTYNSILTSCSNQCGNWIGIRCMPCITFTLASPHSSSIHDSIVAQWSPMASPSSSQWWTDSEDMDTLYTHTVLLSLMPLNLLNAAEGREQGNYGSDPKLFVYSTVVVFIQPSQVLTTIQNAVGFFLQWYDAILQGGHSNGWCTLCKLPHYETSQYLPMVPHMLCLALPILEPSRDPTVWPQLCLDTAGCDTDHMIIWLLHHMWCHDMDYAMIPPALQSNLDVPWDLCMEEYPKLWRNSIYTTWKVGSPREEVSLAMTFVSTSHREFDSGQLILDISDEMAIQYPVSKVDDNDDSDESTGDVVEDNNDKDDSDDDVVDEDLHKMVTEIANKTDDSGFHSGTEDNSKIRPLSPLGQPGWARCHHICWGCHQWAPRVVCTWHPKARR